MQASLNRYRLKHINLLREKVRAKGGRVTCSGLDATEKYNSYVNDVYTNNQHMHLNTRDAISEIKCNPVYGISVLHFQCFLQQLNLYPKHCRRVPVQDVPFFYTPSHLS